MSRSEESLRRELETHHRNLDRLEEQKAQYGLDVPLRIQNAIEQERKAIARLEAMLSGGQLERVSHPARSQPTDGTTHETYFYGEIKGPVHTGSGDIYSGASTHSDTEELAQLHDSLATRINAASYRTIAAIVQQLSAERAGEIQTILMAIEAQSLSQHEMTKLLTKIESGMRQALRERLLSNMAQQVSQAIEILETPQLGVEHKLKLTLPIIPFLLDYEGELQLGSRMDLEMAWNWLMSKIRR